MRKLLILSVLTILAAGSTGCNTCGRPACGTPSICSWRPRMFSGRQQECCAPAATCCDPCGGAQYGGAQYGGAQYGGAMDGMTAGSAMMPAESSCCQ